MLFHDICRTYAEYQWLVVEWEWNGMGVEICEQRRISTVLGVCELWEQIS